MTHRDPTATWEPEAATVSADGGAPGDTAPTPPTAPGLGEAGQVFGGKYQLVELIGEGGMGRVWLARQVEPVTRLVAVKVVRAGQDGNSLLARFEAERQALAVMDHPNIARIHDGGLHDGRPYFVMELVRGVPLTRYCDDRRLTPADRLRVFLQVCLGVQHAHMKGVIHRDLKPSNILVAEYDDRPVPKVIDFGVAKAAGAPLTDLTLVTGVGAVVGTPEYMSPEQAGLNCQDVDTRSDVYSLGVLLYELLTGTTPVDRRSLRQASLLDVLRIVREEPPPTPSTRVRSSAALPAVAAARGVEPTALAGLLRNELEWIVMKALEKDRARRYESVSQLAADVDNYLHRRRTVAGRPSRWHAAKNLLRRNRALAWAVAAAAVVVVALWGVQRRADGRHHQAMAQAALRRYLEADPVRLPLLLEELRPFHGAVEAELRSHADDATAAPDTRLRARLALVAAAGLAADQLENDILEAKPFHAVAIGVALGEGHPDWKDRLWRRAAGEIPVRRLRVAAVLAQFDAASPNWDRDAGDLAAALLAQNPVEAGEWATALGPVMPRLHDRLAAVVRDPGVATADQRELAARLLAAGVGDPGRIARLLQECDERAFVAMFPPGDRPLRDQVRLFHTVAHDAEASVRARRNASAALLRIDEKADIDALLLAAPDPALRTALIHKLPTLGVPVDRVVSNLTKGTSAPSVRSAWTQMLGWYPEEAVSQADKDAVAKAYPDEPDPELRASREWLLRKWGRTQELVAAEKRLAGETGRLRREEVLRTVAAGGKTPPLWFPTAEGQVMVAVSHPEVFDFGLRPGDRDRYPENGAAVSTTIPRAFAISSKPVTSAEFRRWKPDFKPDIHFCKDDDAPILGVTWSEAAEYCDWLSRTEKLSECYARSEKGITLPRPDALARGGYRLPTEAEWEYACRGGTVKTRFYGASEFVEEYGNFGRRAAPVGRSLPNPLGLFDLHGNVFNWCHDAKTGADTGKGRPAIDRGGHPESAAAGGHRILRGSSFLSDKDVGRSDLRSWAHGNDRYVTYGFRIARTLRADE